MAWAGMSHLFIAHAPRDVLGDRRYAAENSRRRFAYDRCPHRWSRGRHCGPGAGAVLHYRSGVEYAPYERRRGTGTPAESLRSVRRSIISITARCDAGGFNDISHRPPVARGGVVGARRRCRQNGRVHITTQQIVHRAGLGRTAADSGRVQIVSSPSAIMISAIADTGVDEKEHAERAFIAPGDVPAP